MNYYYISKTELTPGDYLLPFQFFKNNQSYLSVIDKYLMPKGSNAIWGAIIMDLLYQKKGLMSSLIEYVLEDVRDDFFPTKKSRFDAIFLWDDIQFAHRFIEKYNLGKIIYLCELESGIVDKFDMEIINAGIDIHDNPSVQLDNLYERAKQYWTGNNNMQWPEILAWGKVRVISKL